MTELMRQLDILDPRQSARLQVTLIGAGGIGSSVGFCLAKMGIPFAVYDMDLVEPHNQPNQLYGQKHFGAPKVVALQEICRELAGVEIEAHPEAFTTQPLTNLVISAVDSLAVRKRIWAQLTRQKATEVYIDGRMSGQGATIFVLPMDRLSRAIRQQYVATMNGVPEQEPCTGRAIMYTAFLIGGYVGKLVQMVATEQPLPHELLFDVKHADALNFLAGYWE